MPHTRGARATACEAEPAALVHSAGRSVYTPSRARGARWWRWSVAANDGSDSGGSGCAAHVGGGEALVEDVLRDGDREDLLEGAGNGEREGGRALDHVHLGEYDADDEAADATEPACGAQ
eukprot:6255711-Prymnesium_polylepis.1